MARPSKPGIDYFPLDVDFFDNDKIALIEGEFGVKGSYVALRLLCKIYKRGYFYPWGGDECLLLSRQLGAGFVPAAVDEIVKGLVRRSFFDKGVYDSFQVLTSQGIQRRYVEARRGAVEIDPKICLLGVFATKTPVFATKTPPNKIKEKEKREKESVEKGETGSPVSSPPPAADISRRGEPPEGCAADGRPPGAEAAEKEKLRQKKESERQRHGQELRLLQETESIERLAAELRAELAGDTMAAESAVRQFGLRRDQLAEAVGIFVDKLRIDGVGAKTRGDFRRHFQSWLKLNVQQIFHPQPFPQSPTKNHATNGNTATNNPQPRSAGAANAPGADRWTTGAGGDYTASLLAQLHAGQNR